MDPPDKRIEGKYTLLGGESRRSAGHGLAQRPSTL